MNAQKIIENMTDDEFEQHKATTGFSEYRDPEDQKAMALRYWHEIENRKHMFERVQIERQLLRTLGRDGLLRLYQVNI